MQSIARKYIKFAFSKIKVNVHVKCESSRTNTQLVRCKYIICMYVCMYVCMLCNEALFTCLTSETCLNCTCNRSIKYVKHMCFLHLNKSSNYKYMNEELPRRSVIIY